MPAPDAAPSPFIIQRSAPDAVHLRFDVTVPSAVFAKTRAEAFRDINSKAQIKGFRPGKAPVAMVERMYGPAIQSTAEETVVERVGQEILADKDLSERLVTSIRLLSDFRFELDGTAHFALLAEVKPELGSLNWEGLAVTAPDPKPTEEMIDAAMEERRLAKATLQTVADRDVVAPGDTAVCDYEGTLEGEDKPHGLLTTQGMKVLAVDADAPLSTRIGIAALLGRRLVGLKVGDTQQFELVLPPEYALPAMVGKKAAMTLTVREIQVSVPPPLDDDFARDLEFDDLAAMRAAVAKEVAEKAAKEARSLLENELVQALLERYPVPAPPALARSRAIDIMSRALQGMGRMTPEMARQFLPLFLPRAQRDVGVSLLVSELREQMSVEVDEAALEARMAEMAEKENEPLPKVKARYSTDESAREELKFDIETQMIMDRLAAAANIQWLPLPEFEKWYQERQAKERAAAEAQDAAEAAAEAKAEATPEATAEAKDAKSAAST